VPGGRARCPVRYSSDLLLHRRLLDPDVRRPGGRLSRALARRAARPGRDRHSRAV